MRILITTDVAGGVWRYTAELADGLHRHGHELALVSFGGAPSRAQSAWVEARPWLTFEAGTAPLEWEREPARGLAASGAALQAFAKRWAPDAVHLNQYYYGALDLGAPKLVTCHSDVVSWWRAVKHEEPPQDAWFERYRAWVGGGLRGADARVAPSRFMADELERAYACGPVRVIHNARTPTRGPRAVRLRERAVLTAGRLWDEGKGARDLAAVARRMRDVRFLFAGAAAHPTGGPDFAAGAPGVEWLGELDDSALNGWLARAAAYAATSHYEPFGLAPLEAALAGCPLICADIPSFRELWHGCAQFYPAGDSDALGAAIRNVLDAPAHAAWLAARALQRAHTLFSPARMVSEYEAAYSALVRGSHVELAVS